MDEDVKPDRTISGYLRALDRERLLWLAFSWHGRLDRRTYFYSWLLYESAHWSAVAMTYFVGLFSDTLSLLLAFVVALISPYIGIVISIKRAHDYNYNGMAYILYFPASITITILLSSIGLSSFITPYIAAINNTIYWGLVLFNLVMPGTESAPEGRRETFY